MAAALPGGMPSATSHTSVEILDLDRQHVPRVVLLDEQQIDQAHDVTVLEFAQLGEGRAGERRVVEADDQHMQWTNGQAAR